MIRHFNSYINNMLCTLSTILSTESWQWQTAHVTDVQWWPAKCSVERNKAPQYAVCQLTPLAVCCRRLARTARSPWNTTSVNFRS